MIDGNLPQKLDPFESLIDFNCWMDEEEGRLLERCANTSSHQLGIVINY